MKIIVHTTKFIPLIEKNTNENVIKIISLIGTDNKEDNDELQFRG